MKFSLFCSSKDTSDKLYSGMNPSVRSSSSSNKSLQLEPVPEIVFEQNGGLLVSRILKFNFRDVDWQDPCPLHVTTLSSVAVNVISIASTQLF